MLGRRISSSTSAWPKQDATDFHTTTSPGRWLHAFVLQASRSCATSVSTVHMRRLHQREKLFIGRACCIAYGARCDSPSSAAAAMGCAILQDTSTLMHVVSHSASEQVSASARRVCQDTDSSADCAHSTGVTNCKHRIRLMCLLACTVRFSQPAHCRPKNFAWVLGGKL